jgi:hypothetical protein
VQGNLSAIDAAAADDRATRVMLILKDLDQAGRGIKKVFDQLATGVPQGNELHYLIIVQGMVNSAAFELSDLAIPPAAPEAPDTNRIVI